ncbi:hypothetical protein TNCV_332801 [Trichonephila clavipes]|nr:hypothetical protein TNCV_332801 [Trichonephila clavipes]
MSPMSAVTDQSIPEIRDMKEDDPIIQQKGKRCFLFETGIHCRRNTGFFAEEDTTISYSGFELEPTRLQAEGHSHH